MDKPKFEKTNPGEAVRALLYEQAALLADYNAKTESVDYADVRANVKIMLDIYEAIRKD